MSRLENLSHIDFEELCRDLAYAETGKRFSAFGPGADGGIDGRHSKGDQSTILQCKHYRRSSFSNLKSALQNEVINLRKLQPKRYLFFTSQSLTPRKSDELAEILGAYLKQPEDIWGKEDIEAAIKRYPDIEKSHIKLWLSNTAVLERILHSGLEAFTHATEEEILSELRVYVSNRSFDEGIEKLEKQKILIVSGPPGVGKTTLARMIAYHYLKENWRFFAINSLEDGFAKIDDRTPTVFYFDDFLGRVELNRQALLQRESAFGMFVRRISNSKNLRFILTTRAHIFEEATLVSDYIEDKKLQISKYILNVDAYTRKIKAQILFNHLSVSDLTPAHFEALLKNDWLKKIIDHQNYNPRVVASVSSGCLENIEPNEYPKFVYNSLNNPNLIWSNPFRALPIKSQNLLICLFFGSEYGQDKNELRVEFIDMHRNVCSFHSQPTRPSDFNDALYSLESGFISISGDRVRFVNPSLRDFLKSYLDDIEFLKLLPKGAKRTDWAGRLWSHVKNSLKPHPNTLSKFANLFREFASVIDKTQSMKHSETHEFWHYLDDKLTLSGNVDILLQWWEHTHENLFLQKALEFLQSSSLELISWRDGQSLPELHWWINKNIDDDHSLKADLITSVEERIVDVLESEVSLEELVPIVEIVYEYMTGTMSKSFESALDYTLVAVLDETEWEISALDSKQDLLEYNEYIDALAKVTGLDPRFAIEVIDLRLAEIENEEQHEARPTFQSRREPVSERFNDQALYSLFSNLIN